MNPGGVTDIIAHFAGYFRLYEETWRPTETYYGDRSHPTQPWSEQSGFPHAHRAEPDDTASRPIRDLPSADAPIMFGKLPKLPVSKPAFLKPHVDPAHPTGEQVPAHAGGGGGGGGHHAAIYSETTPTPHETNAEIFQVNALHDDDLLLMTSDARVLSLHGIDPELAIRHLLGVAGDQTPDALRGFWTANHDVVAFVDGRDTARAGESAPNATLKNGVTTDGLLAPNDASFTYAKATPLVIDDAPRNGLDRPGLETITGGNASTNAAQILDESQQRAGLIVVGDAFATNAIVQTNVFSSTTKIDVAGDAAQRTITVGDNDIHNIAAFHQHESSHSFSSYSYPATGHFTVDVIQGNYYSIHDIRQVNLLSDNDTIVQATHSSYYSVIAGANAQVNYLLFSDIAKQYDLIIVGGDYHSSNTISQSNVFLGDTVVKMDSGRDDTAWQTINAGHNRLFNQAQIDKYGSSSFKQADSATLSLAKDAADGNIDSGETGGSIPHAGGTLHVLYITGDMYSINNISQINVVSNIDTAIQYLPEWHGVTSGPGIQSVSTQSVEAGSNQLFNSAQIATVGTTTDYQFVGGSHYEDSILIQSNIVTQKAQITMGDTQTLLPDLVAFTGVQGGAADEHHPSAQVFPHADPSLSHDLFHGVMT